MAAKAKTKHASKRTRKSKIDHIAENVAALDVAVGELQPHPKLKSLVPQPSKEQRDALREDVEARGILYPLLVSSDGFVLDGMTRLAIAKELNLATVPVKRLPLASDHEIAIEIGLSANAARRQMTTGQRKKMAEAYLAEHKRASARSVARLTGLAPNTVAEIKRGLGIDTDKVVDAKGREISTEKIGKGKRKGGKGKTRSRDGLHVLLTRLYKVAPPKAPTKSAVGAVPTQDDAARLNAWAEYLSALAGEATAKFDAESPTLGSAQ